MQDGQPIQQKNWKRKLKRLVSKRIFIPSAGFLIVVLLLALAYTLGSRSGKKQQIIAESKKQNAAKSDLAKDLPGYVTNYWSVVGTVTKIADNKITVKNNKGLVQEAVVNKDTKISSKLSQNLSLKDVSVGSTVIVTGKRENNVNDASVVRIKL